MQSKYAFVYLTLFLIILILISIIIINLVTTFSSNTLKSAIYPPGNIGIYINNKNDKTDIRYINYDSYTWNSSSNNSLGTTLSIKGADPILKLSISNGIDVKSGDILHIFINTKLYPESLYSIDTCDLTIRTKDEIIKSVKLNSFKSEISMAVSQKSGIYYYILDISFKNRGNVVYSFKINVI